MSKHTPGPWKQELLPVGTIDIYGTGANADTHIAEVFDAASATLIEAAPAMLHLLGRIMAAHDSGNNGAVMGEAKLCEYFAAQARALIAAAKGEA